MTPSCPALPHPSPGSRAGHTPIGDLMIFTEPGREGQQRCRFAGCGAWIQRTPDGDLADGMAEHRATVHGG